MKTFGVDAETDGLYGSVWAIGAIVLNTKGFELDRFGGQITTRDLKDPFVIKNIVPVVKLPMYDHPRALREAFWKFWMQHRTNADCVADHLYPVESGLFRELYQDDPRSRLKLGPNPIHEIQTAYRMATRLTRESSLMVPGLEHVVKHNPVDDALVAARVYHHCMELADSYSTH